MRVTRTFFIAAWVIRGGLVTSTLRARVVTPVLYKLLAPSIATAHAQAEPDRVGKRSFLRSRSGRSRSRFQQRGACESL